MSNVRDQGLLEALLDSWDRNNTILINLLGALPEGGLEARPMEGSPSISELFTHIHYVRLVFVLEDAPEFAGNLPAEEWAAELDTGRIAQRLNESARAVRDAVKSRVEEGREMNLHYDHPVLLLQHMIWHEGYHHGQMKLTLKMTGRPLANERAGPVTWGVWMRKTRTLERAVVMSPGRFEIGEPAPLDVQFLEDRLYESNRGATGIDDGHLLGIFLRDESGNIVAGAAGHTWGGTCELRQVWVAPALRGRGLGRRLVFEAKAEAVLRGCRQLVLSTYSFQAPAFYQKLGFEILSEVPDSPQGHTHIVMRKRLASSAH
jgi:ribosomal protein S18 acetylase RimI-like enzyme/uncharacterized damage-inducible protein DinB